MIGLRFLCALLAAVTVMCTSAAQAAMKTEWVEYTHGQTKLKGYLAYDDSISGKRPAIFLVHRRNGMDANTLQNTEAYAKLGYVVFATDMFGFGEGVLPKDVPAMTAQIDIYYKDRALMRARAKAGLEALVKNPMVDPSRIALLGYCFGGTVGVEMGYDGAPLAGIITIHGSFKDHVSAGAKNVKGKVMILHGADDTVSPLSEVNKIIDDLRGAKVDFQYELYSGSNHGFSTPRNKEEERANVQSIGAATRFLKEVFGI
jgi:dienelactone hydrolase